jgi:hypothetical protein
VLGGGYVFQVYLEVEVEVDFSVREFVAYNFFLD